MLILALLILEYIFSQDTLSTFNVSYFKTSTQVIFLWVTSTCIKVIFSYGICTLYLAIFSSTLHTTAEKCVENFRELMTSKDNVDAVTSEPTKLSKFYEEPSDLCESLIKLPLPHAEVMRQSKYFDGKRTMYCSFIEKVKDWLSEVGHSYVPLNKDLPAQNVAGEDSASNVSRVKANSVTSHFQLARISST